MRPVLIAVGGEPGVLTRGVDVLRVLLAAVPAEELPAEPRADAHATLASLDAALRFAAAPADASPATSVDQLAAQLRAADAPDPTPRCASAWCPQHVPRAGESCTRCAPADEAGEAPR
jgi:hypothetical protein